MSPLHLPGEHYVPPFDLPCFLWGDCPPRMPIAGFGGPFGFFTPFTPFCGFGFFSPFCAGVVPFVPFVTFVPVSTRQACTITLTSSVCVPVFP